MTNGLIAGPAEAGWAQFHDGSGWRDAHFRVVESTGQLVVEADDRPPAAIGLRRITGLDEILGAPAGFHHVEITVGTAVAMEAVWPAAFTSTVTAALMATLEPPGGASGDAAPAPVADSVVAPDPEGLVAPRRTGARAGVIGALALAGLGAVAVGAFGLRNNPDTRPRTVDMVTTTVRVTTTTTRATAPTTTVATTASSTTVVEVPSTAPDVEPAVEPD